MDLARTPLQHWQTALFALVDASASCLSRDEFDTLTEMTQLRMERRLRDLPHDLDGAMSNFPSPAKMRALNTLSRREGDV